MLAVSKWHLTSPGPEKGLLAIASSPGQNFRPCDIGDQPPIYSSWNRPVSDLTRPLATLSSAPDNDSNEIDPLFLFACHIEWEQREDAEGAWELIAAAQGPDGDTRAHARALLAVSRHFGGGGVSIANDNVLRHKHPHEEQNMNSSLDPEGVEEFSPMTYTNQGFFGGLSEPVLRALDHASHKSTVPAGAILFVEGQSPRGMFILCSGRVKLSTTSRDGKILVLKTAEAGEALGLSAAISGMGFEMTAETATTCRMNFIDRKNLLKLLQTHSEIGFHAAQSLSRDFRSAYRDIHDLVLTRSSAGKLARLLLSHSPDPNEPDNFEMERSRSPMTHEEMAQRIGASRETVTRLLSDLKRKRLIGVEGPNLVIHNRTALEALAV